MKEINMAKPLPIEDLDFVLSYTRDLWAEMRGEQVFITGGTGFIGSWLVESFSHVNRVEGLGARAKILTRNPAAFLEKCPHLASDSSITFLTGDVRDFAFPQGHFKYVIHAATESVARKTPVSRIDMLNTIIRGTERVLDFASTHGTSKLLLTSSGAVYGSQPSELMQLPEDFRGAPNVLDPASVYGEGKRVAEHLCALYAAQSTLECKIARCFAFVGPHLALDAHFAIGNFIRDVLQAKPIRILGDGTSIRSYLYAADLAVWLWSILFRGASTRAYNVGSNQSVSIFELAQEVVATLGPESRIEVLQKAIHAAPILRYVPETKRSFEELGLKQRIDLREAILRTACWHGYQGKGA
jgi:dTDP-glucose 4,6-dehydratase